MDVNKNSYTFSFAIVMVILVAGILSFLSEELKPLQKKNIELEKKQSILSSVGVNISRDSAELIYPSIIKDEIILNSKGEVLEGSAFDVDLQKELKKNKDLQQLPLFVSQIDSKKKYIIPLRGKGLWGPIWGFIALEEDFNTVYGAVFDHKAETPGLGAEINTPIFEDQFAGKTIYEAEELVSILVVKGGADPMDMHSVDGISGGTITSDGVSDMLSERLSLYSPYLEKMKLNKEVEYGMLEMDTVESIVDSLIN